MGLFRYWTWSNLPLFILAAPMITLMALSTIWAISLQSPTPTSKSKSDEQSMEMKIHHVVPAIALSQLLLLVLTVTTAHVQIITRLASASPVWMWYVAHMLHNGNSLTKRFVVPYMVIYGLVQAGLYASFLPPA